MKENEIHQLGCDHEECPKCHRQLISCDCNYENDQMRIPKETLAQLWGKKQHDEISITMRRKPQVENGENIIHQMSFLHDSWDQKGRKNKDKSISVYKRILSGKESFYKDNGTGECSCCVAKIGEYHVPMCKLEECPQCGSHLFNCDCELEEIFQFPEEAFDKIAKQ